MKVILLFIFIFYSNLFSNENYFYLPFSSQIKDTIVSSKQTDTLKFQMTKSPWNAVIRSAVIPGLGQFYNESYWKIPIVIGAIGYLGYQWNFNDDLYKKYKNLIQQSLDNNQLNNNYYKLREFYRDQRDLFAIYIGLAYILNIIDAYVDSHLFDFNINESNLSKNYMISIKLKL